MQPGSVLPWPCCGHISAIRPARVHSLRGRCPVDPALYPYRVGNLPEVVAGADPGADEELLARWLGAMNVACATFTGRHAPA